MRRILLLMIVISSWSGFSQQFEINADLRARFENRNGFGTLKPIGERPSAFISQRTRIILDYSAKNIKLRISPQNIRTWGDVATNSKADLNNAVHEAFGEVTLSEKLAIKLGRQEINYDDARILGNVDWAMQARSHDAFLVKISPNSKNQLHIGVAHNANSESNFYQAYLVPQYKALQYVWYHTDINKLNMSVLILNNGMHYLVNTKEKLAYSQTLGLRLVYKNGGFIADGATYIQAGKITDKKVSASYVSANISYKTKSNFAIGLGFERLSGKGQNDKSATLKSFNPLYGTNHKFNGFMDYFYVGNHSNTVGLTDFYSSLGVEKGKFSAKLVPHYFASAASIYKAESKQNNYLGTEIDLTLNYKLYDNVAFEAGFSKMMASSTMEILKTRSKNEANNWQYLTVKINPSLFTNKPALKQ